MAMASPRRNDGTRRPAPSGMVLRNDNNTHEVEVAKALNQWAVTVTALADNRLICPGLLRPSLGGCGSRRGLRAPAQPDRATSRLVSSAAPGYNANAALPKRIRHHYLYSFQDPRRERLFLSSLGFDLGAITARVITHLIRHGIGPFHNLTRNGRHLHHLVFGIGGLLSTGYLWLVIADDAEQQRGIHRATSFAYGVGSA